MARGFCSVSTEGKIALSAASAKTVLQLVAPAQQRVALRSVYVSFDASSSAQPVEIVLMKQTTAGTMSSASPVKDDKGPSFTIQTTAQKNATVEPTAGDVLRRYLVHPQAGLERVFGGPGDEIVLDAGERIGLQINAPAGVNTDAGFTFEE